MLFVDHAGVSGTMSDHHVMKSRETRLSKRIQSIAISESGDRAVALVNHDHVYCFDLSGQAELNDADCWVVPRPSQQGNRRVERHDSAIVSGKEDQVYLCHVTEWNSDPKHQLNIQELDLRTGTSRTDRTLTNWSSSRTS